MLCSARLNARLSVFLLWCDLMVSIYIPAESQWPDYSIFLPTPALSGTRGASACVRADMCYRADFGDHNHRPKTLSYLRCQDIH